MGLQTKPTDITKEVKNVTYQLELEAFKQAMLAKGFTIAGLSKHCGISITSIYCLIRGNACKVQTAHKIATALDVPVTDLFK
jgi:DNA-binding helix-turn-helix protein|nr:MAG TPA: helix-turn-helix domain protein [Caudoviricetes sp.]